VQKQRQSLGDLGSDRGRQSVKGKSAPVVRVGLGRLDMG
jgi:hypothetical protein